ncbi:MAG: hypothetical protein JJ899_10330, partial [Alphaproteobacteria bacterium]|nr:hypothetical protein [Alphaproteobacteria bacterium]
PAGGSSETRGSGSGSRGGGASVCVAFDASTAVAPPLSDGATLAGAVSEAGAAGASLRAVGVDSGTSVDT